MTDPRFLNIIANPFGLTDVGFSATPTFADIDGDGDLDAFVGNSNGNLLFYRNTGTATNPVFATPTTNPFNLTDVGNFAAPTFADIDGDGDLDAFVGNSNGNTFFYRNTGNATNPVFATPTTNPFNLTDVGNFAKPTFADIDGDGDLDAFMGNSDGNTFFYRNTGTATNPQFADPSTNPFGLTDVGNYTAPTFADVDGDGDLDALVGNFEGNTFFYRNTGTATNPQFAAPSTNPFGLTTVGSLATPTLADIDGDGDLDAFVGNSAGDTNFLQNQPASRPAINFRPPTINPFGLTNVELYAAPTLADIDGDGDLDAFVGNNNGNTFFYRNTGTASNPEFAAPSTNPFGLTDVGNFAKPTFADIDGDGDLDAFVGNFNGNTFFYRNTGTASNPEFAAPSTNPFGLTDVGFSAAPTFADIDGDGDLDAFVGNTYGNTFFYRNIGTASNPEFAAPSTNPFGLTDVGSVAKPTFADIDGDGDLDAFVGNLDGNTVFYRNIGTASNPEFADPSTNPFGLTDVGFSAAPTFADIDGDGDLDAFVGNFNGNTLVFLANRAPIVSNPLIAVATEDDAPFSVNLLANATDLDTTDTLSVANLTVTGNNAGITLTGNTLNVSPSAYASWRAGDVAEINYSYQVSDSNGGLTPQSATIRITGVNDNPVAGDDRNITSFNTPVLILVSNLLLNDSDIDSNPLTLNVINAINGTAVLTSIFGNDVIEFTPDPGFIGDASFDYTVSDGFGGTDIATVTVTVLPNRIIGTSANNTLIGTDFVDFINGLEGNDYLDGLGGNDTLDGGAGNLDRIFGRDGDDRITDPDGVNEARGGAGNDEINVTFVESWDNDTITTNAPRSDNRITGGFGNDVINVTMNNSNFFINLKADEATTNQPQDGNDVVTLLGSYASSVVDMGGGNDLFNGGVGNDNVSGQNGDDILNGGDGNDILNGNNDNDTLDGGAGNLDRILGGDGDDRITDPDGVNEARGGAGNDEINVTFVKSWDNDADSTNAPRSDNRITGGFGNDVINVTMNNSNFFINLKADEATTNQPQDGNDVVTLLGSYASSVVDMGGGNDLFNGGVGNDNVSGQNGDDILNGGDGNDILNGNNDNDTLDGGAGNLDRILGGDGDDRITDPDGVNEARGGAGNDEINVTFVKSWDNDADSTNAPRSDNRITGGFGNDVINVTMNNSNFFINLKADEATTNQPQDGNDVVTLLGSYASSVVDMGGGNDLFNGGVGNDNVSGQNGDDILNGGDGNDILNGGDGGDLLTGGLGSDTFRYNALTNSLLSNFDRITDLHISNDVIDGPNTVSAANLAELGAVTALTQADISAVLTNGSFVANRAATFSFGSRTFLALNNGTAGFQENSDAVIEITGFSGNLTNLAIV
ncbi:MAG: VCBS repeat-containing protein [Goleter apudmare HA4340-LM2]|jgi:Ca2+-binding RTX toxin-like protein|nr:VCBS repeat-containing protein [Goleter apudmare HA4340-LM2]